jgi:hypothetical protein
MNECMWMIGGMVQTGEGRSTWERNKTHVNPAQNGKFLEENITN